jgi:hypothetical protein
VTSPVSHSYPQKRHSACFKTSVMAELVALRAILLNVLFRQSNGERLTAEEMQRLVDRADSDKLGKARERLLQAQESERQRKEKS